MTMTTASHVLHGRLARRRRCGFTITELLIAVVLLIIIMLVAYRIFSTSSQVVRVGEGMAGINQELAAIERVIRDDFKRMSRDGFFAIRSVAVPNDIRGEPLLNPALPPEAVVRCDQMVFFTTGFEGVQTFPRNDSFNDSGLGQHRKPRAMMSRMYYGHGFQIPEQSPLLFAFTETGGDLPGVEPWFAGGPTPMVNEAGNATDGFIPPVPATQWTLARQPVLMIDDGGGLDSIAFFDATLTVFNSQPLLYLDPANLEQGLLNSVFDISAQQANLVRRHLQLNGPGNFSTWNEQRNRMLGQYLYYPRAERIASAPSREAQAMTMPTLSVACSSFIIEWTYDDETGQATNADDQTYRGVIVDSTWPQPWFGLPDYAFDGEPTVNQPQRQVLTLGDGVNVQVGDLPWRLGQPPATTVIPEVIESTDMLDWNGAPIAIYEATFGPNQDAPFVHPDTGLPDPYVGSPPTNVNDALFTQGFTPYTPWPSAVRITMTLHDARGRIEEGREVQFVIDLPKR